MPSRMLNFGSIRPAYWFLIALAVTTWLAIVDRMTGPCTTFSFFYLLPVAATAWFAHRWQALALALFGACAQAWADGTPGTCPSGLSVEAWRWFNHVCVYLVGAVAIHALRRYWQMAHALLGKDELTGLTNHRVFMDHLRTRVRHCISKQMPFVVAFIDLDDFRQINRLHGFDTGDRVLHAVGDALQKVRRPGDVACRVRSDQFVLLSQDASRDGAALALDSLNDELSALPHHLPEVRFTACVVTVADLAVDAHAVMKAAYNGVVDAKYGGKGTVVFRTLSTSTRSRPVDRPH